MSLNTHRNLSLALCLQVLPEELFGPEQFANLQCIDMSYNLLTSLPPNLGIHASPYTNVHTHPLAPTNLPPPCCSIVAPIPHHALHMLCTCTCSPQVSLRR